MDMTSSLSNVNSNHLIMDVEKRKKKPNTVLNKELQCPFCEDKVPEVITDGLMLDERETMYWAENKFPILKDTYQTLIVESKKCGEDLTTYSEDYAKELFTFIFSSREKLKRSGDFKEVLFFKNHGKFSGSTIAHSHSQIIGLKDITYNYSEIEDSVKGPVIFENEHVTVTVSDLPRAESYEFNITWAKDDYTQEYVRWIQTLVSYISSVKNYDSYNLLFHETSDRNIMKVIPKRTNSIFYIGYGIKQVSNDLTQVAKEIREYIEKPTT